MNKRIVITGLGVISSIGIGRKKFWDALIKGTSGITKVESFDTSEFSVHYGGEVKNFSPGAFIDKGKIEKMGRSSQLAIGSAKLALDDAGLRLDDFAREKIGVCIGTTMGESKILEELDDAWVKKGLEHINVKLIPQYPAYALSSNVALEFKLEGPNYIIPNACAAGNFAIGYAYDLIRQGEADIMLAGGVDGFAGIAFIGFSRLFAIAPLKVQPFDLNRKGMMVGEGAAMVVLETLENALRRGHEIYAEILGYGVSCDAHHMTAPQSDGIAAAIEKSLKESNLTPEDIDYFNAHGTGTPANDKEECMAIKKVFGGYYKKLPVSSIKSMLGHTMGAASAIEAVACCLAIKNDILPPTINYETPDPDCDIDCVPNHARPHKVNIALNSASAFGGNNACLALKKYPAA